MKREIQTDLLASPDEGSEGGIGLVPTRALLRHRSSARVLEQIHRVRFFFPELTGTTIRVGLTRAAHGYASTDEMTIWMNPHKLSHYTIAHELVHLLQNIGLVPGGEKSADLHALARHVAIVDDLPGYLWVPKGMLRLWSPKRAPLRRLLHETARDSLALTHGTYRRSIRWFEKTLPIRWEMIRAELPAGPLRAPQLALL